MKKGIIMLMLASVLTSCTHNEDADLDLALVGNWKLVQMTGNTTNSTTTGSDMQWQENYHINTDGTFIKTRGDDGSITEISGTYKLKDLSNEILLELNYGTESEIIGSCSSDLTETMTFSSETSFFSSWQACDGPGLVYKKVD